MEERKSHEIDPEMQSLQNTFGPYFKLGNKDKKGKALGISILKNMCKKENATPFSGMMKSGQMELCTGGGFKQLIEYMAESKPHLKGRQTAFEFAFDRFAQVFLTNTDPLIRESYSRDSKPKKAKTLTLPRLAVNSLTLIADAWFEFFNGQLSEKRVRSKTSRRRFMELGDTLYADCADELKLHLDCIEILTPILKKYSNGERKDSYLKIMSRDRSSAMVVSESEAACLIDVAGDLFCGPLKTLLSSGKNIDTKFRNIVKLASFISVHGQNMLSGTSGEAVAATALKACAMVFEGSLIGLLFPHGRVWQGHVFYDFVRNVLLSVFTNDPVRPDALYERAVWDAARVHRKTIKSLFKELRRSLA